jgi:hypothetical protein
MSVTLQPAKLCKKRFHTCDRVHSPLEESPQCATPLSSRVGLFEEPAQKIPSAEQIITHQERKKVNQSKFKDVTPSKTYISHLLECYGAISVNVDRVELVSQVGDVRLVQRTRQSLQGNQQPKAYRQLHMVKNRCIRKWR